MFTKLSYLLDAIDIPSANPIARIVSGFLWSLVLVGFFFSCCFFAYIFQ